MVRYLPNYLWRTAVAMHALPARLPSACLAACSKAPCSPRPLPCPSPQVKAAPAGSVDEVIENDVNNHDVFIYMKGIPQAPMCGFSNMACAILNLYGALWCGY